jgi:hypothetical protein
MTNSIFSCAFGKTGLLGRGFSPVNRDIKSKRVIKRLKCFLNSGLNYFGTLRFFANGTVDVAEPK